MRVPRGPGLGSNSIATVWHVPMKPIKNVECRSATTRSRCEEWSQDGKGPCIDNRVKGPSGCQYLAPAVRHAGKNAS